jgi:hypothetical protein
MQRPTRDAKIKLREVARFLPRGYSAESLMGAGAQVMEHTKPSGKKIFKYILGHQHCYRRSDMLKAAEVRCSEVACLVGAISCFVFCAWQTFQQLMMYTPF